MNDQKKQVEISLLEDSLMSNKLNDDSQVQLQTIKMFETGFKTFFPQVLDENEQENLNVF